MKVFILILGLLGSGALFGAFDAEDDSERTLDLAFAGGAAAVIVIWALIDRSRRTSFARGLKGPWTAIVVYTIAIPAAVYLVVVNAFHLGVDVSAMLAGVVSIGGLAFAARRYSGG